MEHSDFLIDQNPSGGTAQDLLELDSHSLDLSSRTSIPNWREQTNFQHFARFYETEEFLVKSLHAFVSGGLTADEAVIVVATRSHQKSLELKLLESGVDLISASVSGRYIALDAVSTLEQFLVEGTPDPVLFRKLFGETIENARKRCRGVRVFGEMVALLWEQKRYESALKLEELWNDLQTIHPFVLFCGYSLNAFNGSALTKPLADICSRHTHVIPSESFTELSEEARRKAIIEFQHKARSLEAEIAERKQTEETLRSVKESLETQVEDLRRLHEMTVNLTSSLDIDALLHEVLRAAMAVQGTDLGSLSLCDSDQNELRLKVQCGFDEEIVNKIDFVPPDTPQGTAFRQRRRIVVEDMEVNPDFAAYRELALLGGLRACHSTPLITGQGTIIGVLSVYFRYPHRPSEREIRLIDLYARMAADSIEGARLHLQLQQQLETREQLLSREQSARADAEHANRMKDEFLATVSHELRTPLNAIIGWSHILRTRRLDDRAIERALDTIDRNARSQAQLIEDILDVSRVVSGKLRLNMAPVDIAAVINAAIDSVQLAAESKGIQLAVTLDPSARHTLGDSNRLQQVVWNLLSNAIKFTQHGGLVSIELFRLNGFVEIRVRDTGQGIKPDFLPYIFDRFRQEDGTITRQHGGLGLGLAIVRHLVELHGGTVHAHSAGEGLGSAFTVTLPLSPKPNSAKKNHQQATSENGVRSNSHTRLPLPTLGGIKVLLVDDDRDTLQMLSAVLQEQKANVQTATTAAEALEILDWYEPQVVVSDLAMPDEDGYSFIQKIRKSESSAVKQIPALALTAYVRVEDRARALLAGFNMFVPKPIEPNELITAIANLAEHDHHL